MLVMWRQPQRVKYSVWCSQGMFVVFYLLHLYVVDLIYLAFDIVSREVGKTREMNLFGVCGLMFRIMHCSRDK